MPAEAAAVAEAPLPKGRTLRAKLGRDDLVMRGFMAVIALYLVVALALPLYAMLSKSFSTFSFDLTTYEFQVSDAEGNFAAPPVTAAELNAALQAVPPAELATSGDGRLPATPFFPDFSFRSPVMYRLRGTTNHATFLVGSEPFTWSHWPEVASTGRSRDASARRELARVGLGG